MDGNENNWQCPYCGCFQLLSSNLRKKETHELTSMSKYGQIGVRLLSILA